MWLIKIIQIQVLVSFKKSSFDWLTLVSFCLLLVVILGGGIVTNDDEFRMNFISAFAFDFVSVDADDACCHFSYRCCFNLKLDRRSFQWRYHVSLLCYIRKPWRSLTTSPSTIKFVWRHIDLERCVFNWRLC